MINIKVDKRDMNQLGKMLKKVPKGLPKALRSGINTTATQTKNHIAKKVKEKITIDKTEVKKRIKIKRATQRGLQAFIFIKDKRIPLIKFGAKTLSGTKKLAAGVSYKMGRGSKRKQIRDKYVFISTVYGRKGKDPVTNKWIGIKKREAEAEGKKGHKGVFRRFSKQHKLIELFGPSTVGVIEKNSKIKTGAKKKAAEILYKNIEKKAKLLIEKQRAG